MHSLRAAMVCGLAVVAMAGLGCDKEYRITFLNGTTQSRELEMSAPGANYDLGVISPGGKVRQKVKIDKDELPARVSWSAGDLSGSFVLRSDMDGNVVVPIDKAGYSPMGKKDEIHKKREVEVREVPVFQEEVID